MTCAGDGGGGAGQERNNFRKPLSDIQGVPKKRKLLKSLIVKI
jgi:hypothetical protein